MHKSTVSFGVNGGDTKGKGSIMVVSAKNLGPTFNNGEAGMLSIMVLTIGITLAGVVVGFSGRVEDEIRPQWVAQGLRLPGALVVELVD